MRVFDSIKFYKNFISVYTSYTSTSSVYIGLSFLYGDYSEMTVLCETQRTNLQLTRSGGSIRCCSVRCRSNGAILLSPFLFRHRPKASLAIWSPSTGLWLNRHKRSFGYRSHGVTATAATTMEGHRGGHDNNTGPPVIKANPKKSSGPQQDL